MHGHTVKLTLCFNFCFPSPIIISIPLKLLSQAEAEGQLEAGHATLHEQASQLAAQRERDAFARERADAQRDASLHQASLELEQQRQDLTQALERARKAESSAASARQLADEHATALSVARAQAVEQENHARVLAHQVEQNEAGLQRLRAESEGLRGEHNELSGRLEHATQVRMG